MIEYLRLIAALVVWSLVVGTGTGAGVDCIGNGETPNALQLLADAANAAWSISWNRQPLITRAHYGVKSEKGCKVVAGNKTNELFEDVLGRGLKTVLTHRIDKTGVQLRMSLFVYEAFPLLGLEAEVRNRGTEPYPLGEIVLGEAKADADGSLSLGVPAQRCSMLGGAKWMIDSKMTRFDRCEVGRAYWSTAVGDRDSLRAVVMGVGEAANCEALFEVRRVAKTLDLVLRAGCAQDKEGKRPLLIPPGGSFRTCRFFVLPCERVHEGLEQYAECVRLFGKVPKLQPPYQGIFTGYSSDPELKTVIRLNEKRVNQLLDVLGRELAAYGTQTVKIEFEPRGSPNLLNPKAYRMEEHFPKGARALSDDIRRRGFRPAIQTRTFLLVPSGVSNEKEKIRTIYQKICKDWGFDYLMLDFNCHDARNIDPHRTYYSIVCDRFQAIRDAVGPDVFIEACMCYAGTVIGSVDGFRAALDYRGGKENALLPGFASRYYLHNVVFQLDSEFYDVSQRPFVWGKRVVVTPFSGTRSWCSLCAITGFSFLVGGDIENTTPRRWDLVRTIEPVYGRRGRPVDLLETNYPRVWALNAQYGGRAWKVIGLFNWSHDKAIDLTCDFAKCGLDPDRDYLLFDFWQRKFLGHSRGQHVAALRPRDCQVLHVIPRPDEPALVGSDRHVTGAFAVESLEWDGKSMTLRGCSIGPSNSKTRLYVYLPSAWQRPPLTTDQCEAEMITPDCLGMTVDFSRNQRCHWSVTLDREGKIR